jgi:hypothetical protein
VYAIVFFALIKKCATIYCLKNACFSKTSKTLNFKNLRNFSLANNRKYILVHSSVKKSFILLPVSFGLFFFVPKPAFPFFFFYISATKSLFFFDFQKEKLQENEGDSLVKNK